jgi:16S rRNA (adenine1518-N6/adenine1519-N6)-dimethyltransferase
MRRRRLGQHYLVDEVVVEKMVSFAGIRPSEDVLEIGTGEGALTNHLVGLGKSLTAYEVDPTNYHKTLESVKKGKVRLHLGDAFDESPDFDVLVSSLPYSESSRFVAWISRMKYDRGVVLLQDDFVKKLLSEPGSRDYRAISVLAQLSSDVKALSKVGRDAFSPRPKVGSVIVMIRPRIRLSRSDVAAVRRLFSLRRRQVDSVVGELGMAPHGSFGSRRVNSLSPEEVRTLCGLGQA